MRAIVLPALLALASGQVRQGFLCPEEEDGFYTDGFYADPVQCDKYYKCTGGVAREQLCDDGLVFDEFKGLAHHVDPCDSPFAVVCGERTELQQPSYPSPSCPRRHGTFMDENVCEKYYTCKDGYAVDASCSPGLHFNPSTGGCDWPANVGRSNCIKQTKCLPGTNMCCDGTDVFDTNGNKMPHPTFPNLDDCQTFYVCLQGTDPQLSSCTLGQVYDERNMTCAYPEEVPECTGWYRDDPRFAEYYDEIPADAPFA